MGPFPPPTWAEAETRGLLAVPLCWVYFLHVYFSYTVILACHRCSFVGAPYDFPNLDIFSFSIIHKTLMHLPTEKIP